MLWETDNRHQQKADLNTTASARTPAAKPTRTKPYFGNRARNLI